MVRLPEKATAATCSNGLRTTKVIWTLFSDFMYQRQWVEFNLVFAFSKNFGVKIPVLNSNPNKAHPYTKTHFVT